ncbi:TrmH family RNA methyltransferase [Dokdonella sp.]|uniref:TrmH family RNA methyltransferase n=1 Tax=Dokdonella sp. TaxID=2291710 RepID=UPI0025C53933|nr:TrmH family RNA methyltransferase [Dokdonella sp.]MBX3692303.1 rRNA methyltransferase [Dokdonella sp.]
MTDDGKRRPRSAPVASPWKVRTPPDALRQSRASPSPRTDPAPARSAPEIRLYGLNACLAAFARRAHDLRKVYLVESRIPALKSVLAWCVQHRLGYRVVETGDLDRLTGSRHHEGVCFDLRRPAPLALTDLLATQPAAPAASLLLWLDGVGNPHNLGALLRSAAHFGIGGVIVPRASSLDLSGAAARVAEGGAEAVALARVDDEAQALAALRAAGYAIAASVPRDGSDVFIADLPPRLVLVFGAEGEGMSTALIAAADLRLTIPGSGAVESLNIAASAAVFLAEYRRRWSVVKGAS